MPIARWKTWYPHHINLWRGSLAVQGMSDGAYRGYHNLIMSQWESEDGTLPNDDGMLARYSGLFSRWKKFKPEIMLHFYDRNGRIFNQVQYDHWIKAREVYEKKARLHPESAQSADAVLTDSQQSLSQGSVFVNSLLLEQKPLRKKVWNEEQVSQLYEAYPRHVARTAAVKSIRGALQRTIERGHDFAWLLECVESYARSPAGQKPIGDDFRPHPATWFNQDRYLDDRQEWQKSKSNGASRNGYHPSKRELILQEALEAVDREPSV